MYQRLQGNGSSTAGKFITFLRKREESCLCIKKRLYIAGRSNFQLLLRQMHTGEKASGIRPRCCCTPDFRWFEFHLTPCAHAWVAVVLQMQLAYRESLAPNTLSPWEWAGHDAGTQSKPTTQSSASLLAGSSRGFQSCHQSQRPPGKLPKSCLPLRTNGLGSPTLTHPAGVHQHRWKSLGQAGKFKEA